MKALLLTLCLIALAWPAPAQSVIVGENGNLLGKLKTANLNSTADQPITIGAAKYTINKILVTNVSTDISLGVAAGGVYTGASKTGTTIVAAGQVYVALTGATVQLPLTLAAVTGTNTFTSSTIYLSLTVANGSAATADVYVYGDPLP